MSHVNLPGARNARLTAERTAREMFFAALGASCLCLMLGMLAVASVAL